MIEQRKQTIFEILKSHKLSTTEEKETNILDNTITKINFKSRKECSKR